MKRNRPNRLANVRVDFTSLATVALVLFFALLILNVLGRKKILSLNLPDGPVCGPRIDDRPANPRSVELFLDEKQMYLLGNYDLEDEFVEKVNYQNCYQMLVHQQERVAKEYEGTLIVLIKPMKNSNYGQLVSVLNNLKKANLSRYTVITARYDSKMEALKKLGVEGE